MKKNLLKKIALLFLFYAFSFPSFAQTNVSGFISANTTWSVAGSPYIVVSNALLSHGYRLTIEPGVLVKFNDSCVLQIDGELIAIGTPQNRIIFTSNQGAPSPGDWGKIHFADTSVSATFDISGNYLSGSIMKYCDILYGGKLGYGAIHIEGSSPYISNCRLANSSSNGVYAFESSYISDSSVFDNCTEYGLYFDYLGVNSNKCGLKMIADSIMNNKTGGIYIGRDPACKTVIKNNYFFGNTNRGAIRVNEYISDLELTGNYFVSDTVNNLNLGGAIVLLVNFTVGGEHHYIASNHFINNYTNSLNMSAILFDAIQNGTDTIECNVFLNNQSSGYYSGILDLAYLNNTVAVVRNNLFEGNTQSNTANLYAIAKIDAGGGSSATAYFTNNIIRGNSTASPVPCCKFIPQLTTVSPGLIVTENEFSYNTSLSTLYFDGVNTGNSNYDFVSLHLNNFYNPNSIYELYNNIPYGSPDIYPDSNYWGSTTTQHVDSVIFDYFDQGNHSVVYYSNILPNPVEINSPCFLITGINNVQPDESSSVFPNPFTNQAMIRTGNEFHGATFRLFNIYGQQMSVKENLSGSKIIITRENLTSGIYFFELSENESKIAQGKIILN